MARGVPAWSTQLVQRKKGTHGGGPVGSEVGDGSDLRKKVGHGGLWFRGEVSAFAIFVSLL